MPTNTPSRPTGAKVPQAAASAQAKQTRLPLRASVGWLNPDENGSVRASASVTVGGAFTVHGVKVVSGSKGEFVSMPSYKQSDGNFKDIFHAVTAEAREQMNAAVMAGYEQKLAEQNQNQDREQDGSAENGSDEDLEDDPSEAVDGPVMRM